MHLEQRIELDQNEIKVAVFEYLARAANIIVDESKSVVLSSRYDSMTGEVTKLTVCIKG